MNADDARQAVKARTLSYRAVIPDSVPTTEPSPSLAEHERVIARGLRSFVGVGQALAAIRDGRFYKPGYATFEQYCQERWQISRQQGHRLVNAAETACNLSPIGDKPQPTTESQCRPLIVLDKARQQKAWKQACKEAGAGKVPTAATVAKIVKSMLLAPTAPSITPPAPVQAHRETMARFLEFVFSLPGEDQPAAWKWLHELTRQPWKESTLRAELERLRG